MHSPIVGSAIRSVESDQFASTPGLKPNVYTATANRPKFKCKNAIMCPRNAGVSESALFILGNQCKPLLPSEAQIRVVPVRSLGIVKFGSISLVLGKPKLASPELDLIPKPDVPDLR